MRKEKRKIQSASAVERGDMDIMNNTSGNIKNENKEEEDK